LGDKNPNFDNVTKKDLVFFVKRMMDILTFFDGLKDKKGTRTFTLFPKKNGYDLSFVMMTESTLVQSMMRMDSHAQKKVLDLMKRKIHTLPSDDQAYLSKLGETFPLYLYRNKAVSRLLWSTLFDFEHHETVNRKFAFIVSTDGCSISVYMQRPKVEEFDPVPEDFSQFKTFIGIDPGVNNLVTTFDGKKHVAVSSASYRSDAKFNEYREWELRLRESDADYAKSIQDIQSLKVSSLAAYVDAMKSIWKNFDFLIRFHVKHAFRNWRFKKKSASKKALSNIAKRIVDGRKNVLIGMGDWCQQDGFLKGKCKAPVKRITNEIRKHAKVISIDEHRTSMCCSKCRRGIVQKLRLTTLNRQTREEKLRYCHEIVRCRNNDCSITWQRDINASRNIRSCLLRIALGLNRPLILQRSFELPWKHASS
jgi:transposase